MKALFPLQSRVLALIRARLIPPYEHEGDELQLKHQMIPQDELLEKLGIREDFLSGGGTEDEWKEYADNMKEEYKARRQQIENKNLISLNHIAQVITVRERI